MSTFRFPHLKEIYRQQAEIKQDDYQSYLVMAVCAIILAGIYIIFAFVLSSDPKIGDAIVGGSVALIAIIVIVVIKRSIKYGIVNFDDVWEAKLDAEIHSEDEFQLYTAVERELEAGSTCYVNVIFTANYMIMFSSMGAFVPLTQVEMIYVDEFAKHQRSGDFDLFPAETIYKMGVILKSRAQYHLSSDEVEIRDLLHEIRSRNPSVGFTRKAHAYFFPTPVSAD